MRDRLASALRTFALRGRLDRRGDVQVRGDGEVDRRGEVEPEIDVRVDVEQRHDLLVRQRRRALGLDLVHRDLLEALVLRYPLQFLAH